MFALGWEAPNGWAFSFGDIDIQSKYGERFKAELDIILEHEGSLQVQIGDVNDYRRLELDRPRIVDNLMVKQFLEPESQRKMFRVISGKPLFYPSFYLVVRGDYQGGTILENYLITVDFQQSLALSVKGKPQSDGFFPREKAELWEGKEFPADSEKPEEFEKEKTPEIQSLITAKIEKEKVSSLVSEELEKETGDEKENSGTPAMEKPVISKKSVTPPRVNAPAWMARPPAAIWGVRGEDSYFPGAGGPPPVSPPPMPVMDSPLPVDESYPLDI